MAVRKPRSLAQAQALCERFARLDGEIAAIEEARDAAIARANAVVDADLAPLLIERAEVADKLEPWWAEAGEGLTKGKCKTIELGGCVIGTQAGRASVVVAGDEKDVRDVLSGLRWAKPFLRVSVSLDKVALGKALDGPRAVALAELGISRVEGTPGFVLKRTVQAGTQAKVER